MGRRTGARVIWLGLGAVAIGSLGWAKLTQAYPGGVENYVTDAAPYCASCHSSFSQEQVRNIPAGDSELRRDIEEVHYAAIRKGDGPYKELAPEQREALLKEVQALDNRTSVLLKLPEQTKPGQTLQAEVKVTGGDGPVVGVMLLDADLRYQARPIASSGWQVLGPPQIVGPDGKLQTTWIDRRVPGSPTNLSFVQVYGVSGQNPAPITVTYTLRAPATPGTYPVAAALLYGSEMASTLGTVTDAKTGKKGPRGGFLGHSGRVRFTPLQQVVVR